MFAVIKTGGKQYIVREGQELVIEKLDLESGKGTEFPVLLVADDEGTEVHVGKPTVSGAKVTATIVEHGMGVKKPIIKFKNKSRYRRHTSHRQPFTKVTIDKITV